MLSPLCAKALDLLKDKVVIPATLNILRRMKPARQIEAAELMVATENYSKSFAKALLVATNSAERETSRIRPISGLSSEIKDGMQRDLECLLNDIEFTKDYGADVLRLVVASRYVSKLVENEAIESYLSRNHPAILREFRTIIAGELLAGSLREVG